MSVLPAWLDVSGEVALLLRATLVMGAAWAAAAALRKAGASAAARHIAWLLGIAALLALPVLWYLVPALRLPILPAGAGAAASSVPAVPGLAHAAPAIPDAPLHAGSLVLALAYALGAGTLLLRLVVGRRTLKRLWRDAGPARDPAWKRLLAQLCAEMGLTRPVELRISRGQAVPMTWGTLAPRLLLPAEACEWPPERRRLVLLHELAHVARRDSLSRSLASLACALYWFHPGAWFAARRMRMEQEHAADDRVLMAGGSPQAYAQSLLHLARGAGAGPRLDEVAAMAGMYQLERRLLSITGPARRDRPGAFFLSSSAMIAGTTTLLAAAGVPVSATSTLPRPFEARRADPASSPGMGVDSGRAGSASMRARPAESLSSVPAGSGGSAQPVPGDSGPETQSRPDRPGSLAGQIAQRAAPRGDQSVPGAPRPTNPGPDGNRDRTRPAAEAQRLSDYGWELPRRDSRIGIGSSTDPSRPARLTLPAPLEAASNERTGRPKWTRSVPRLVQGAPPAGTPANRSKGPLMLSWSLGGDGK